MFYMHFFDVRIMRIMIQAIMQHIGPLWCILYELCTWSLSSLFSTLVSASKARASCLCSFAFMSSIYCTSTKFVKYIKINCQDLLIWEIFEHFVVISSMQWISTMMRPIFNFTQWLYERSHHEEAFVSMIQVLLTFKVDSFVLASFSLLNIASSSSWTRYSPQSE